MSETELKYNPDESYRQMMREKKSYTCISCKGDILRTNYSERKRPWDGTCSNCKASVRIKEKCWVNGRPANYCGTDNLKGQLIWSWKRSASNRNKPWNLTNDQLEAQYVAQGGKCLLTGIAFDKSGPNKVSLDRIDNDLGYEVGNIRFVTVTANMMKRTMRDSDMVAYMQTIVDQSKVAK